MNSGIKQKKSFTVTVMLTDSTCEESEAFAGRHTSSPARALVCLRLGDGSVSQKLHACDAIIH